MDGPGDQCDVQDAGLKVSNTGNHLSEGGHPRRECRREARSPTERVLTSEDPGEGDGQQVPMQSRPNELGTIGAPRLCK